MVEVRLFTPEDLDGVIALCAAENWPSFPEDPVGCDIPRGLRHVGVWASGNYLDRDATVTVRASQTADLIVRLLPGAMSDPMR